jgi:hypothetical protein
MRFSFQAGCLRGVQTPLLISPPLKQMMIDSNLTKLFERGQGGEHRKLKNSQIKSLLAIFSCWC